jgi:hypothetical protein
MRNNFFTVQDKKNALSKMFIKLCKERPMESLQSHMILTMSHWSSGLTCLLPPTRVTGSNPLGVLM